MLLSLSLLLTLLVGSAPAATPTQAQLRPRPGPCETGTLPHGALSLICVPERGWNGDLVLWAHGYVAFDQPLDFYHISLPDGTYLPDLVQGLGFAFATTSYRQNGLAVLEGADDVRELALAVRARVGPPRYTYLGGVSEGGLIAALVVEQSPELVSGGLSGCGPIGDFRKQSEYVGDFRVLFDYFFSGLLPPSPISIPKEVIANWEALYVPQITKAVQANPDAARELIKTAKAAVDRQDPSTILATTQNLLWYSAFGTNDAAEKLGGNPYGNRLRTYHGSSNDRRLNRRVERFVADRAALAAIGPYQTSGRLTIPLVTLHTTGDEIVPFWHQVLYLGKARPSGSGKLTQIPVRRYGHCNFTATDALAGFGLLIKQVTGRAPDGITPIPDEAQVRRDFEQAMRDAPRP